MKAKNPQQITLHSYAKSVVSQRQSFQGDKLEEWPRSKDQSLDETKMLVYHFIKVYVNIKEFLKRVGNDLIC